MPETEFELTGPPPECPHVTITLAGEQLECAECHDHAMPLTISNEDMVKFLRVVQDIASGLELAGMTDTAQVLRGQAARLIINRRIEWRP